MVMRLDHSYMPSPSEPWTFTPGSCWMTLSALVPGAADCNALASTADAPRATPRPVMEVVIVTVLRRWTESRLVDRPCCDGDCAKTVATGLRTPAAAMDSRATTFIGAPRG